MTLPPIILPWCPIFTEDYPFGRVGAVYILFAPVPGIHKIGCTNGNAITRARPQRKHGLHLHGWCQTNAPYVAEKAVHDRLTVRRLNPHAELFYISLDEARALVSAVCGTPYETH